MTSPSLSDRASPWWHLPALAVGACMLVTFFFSPRVVVWRGLDAPETWFYPELNRAVDALRQLEAPFADIENPSNMVIEWRLFFPLVGHWTGMPWWLYLALPHVGSVLAVAWLIRILRDRTGDAAMACGGAVAVAASAWFFVSAGWLAYFDAWFVLGLLAVAFADARVALALACLATPWVDERFVLALPLVMAVRVADRAGKSAPRRLWLDLAVIVAASVPYPMARLVALSQATDASGQYVQLMREHLADVSPWRFIEGAWSGFRAAWVFPACAMVMLWTSRPRWLFVLTAATALGTAAACLVVAADMSRSFAMLLPLAVLGVVWCATHPDVRWRRAVPLIAAANLLLPASHVLWTFKEPVYYVYHEWYRWQNPPADLTPQYYMQEAMDASQGGDLKQAAHLLSNAIALDRGFAPSYVGRAAIAMERGHLEQAGFDLAMALELDPRSSDALFGRGLLRQRQGDRAGAARDMQSALALAPPDWPNLAACQRALTELAGPAAP